MARVGFLALLSHPAALGSGKNQWQQIQRHSAVGKFESRASENFKISVM
tara:strand:- start:1124 stop:1270 length:147 start_codon:yes stop_codon:yes gene_type:complete